MQLLAMALGGIVGAMGLVGVAAPSVLLAFGRALQRPTALYIAAAIRVGFGAVLVRVAPRSRMPKPLRILGCLSILVGVLMPFLGVARFQALLAWWAAQGAPLLRLWSGVAVALAGFIVYAVTAPR